MKYSVKLQWESKSSNVYSADEEITCQKTEIIYPCRSVETDSIFDIWVQRAQSAEDNNFNGQIFQGDNRLVMEFLNGNGCRGLFDLIYIDPPYLSSSNYNSIVKIKDAEGHLNDIINRPVFFDQGTGSIDSYLDDIYPRLKLIKDLLSENGSVFVHLDWHVSHYVKVLMDEIFSSDNFINEIIWCYGGGSGSKRHFHRKHDIILWYAKGKKYIFNPQYRPYTDGTLERGLTRVKGDKYKLHEEGALMQDWWVDINKILSPTAGENLKFPTQKPEALLKRIVAAASNQGSLVGDFYAGSGTMASVCQELGRRWIICDDSNIALQTTLVRLIKQGIGSFVLQQVWAGPKPSAAEGSLQLKTPSIQRFNETSVLLMLGIQNYVPLGKNITLLNENWGIKNLIDFWEVDLDYDGKIFHSDVQVFRDRMLYDDSISLDLKLGIPLRKKYKIAVKIYDIFGNCAMEVLEFDGFNGH